MNIPPEDTFCKTIEEWLSCLTNHQHFGDSSKVIMTLGNTPVTSTWVNTVLTDQDSHKALLYRHYLFLHICDIPIKNEPDNLALSTMLSFTTWNTGEYYPLYDTEVWSKIDDQDFLINQLRTLSPLIKQNTIDLSNLDDITPYGTVRDHAGLTAYSLVYGLYLICVSLAFKNKISKTNSSEILLVNITQTLASLKGVLFHVTD